MEFKKLGYWECGLGGGFCLLVLYFEEYEEGELFLEKYTKYVVALYPKGVLEEEQEVLYGTIEIFNDKNEYEYDDWGKELMFDYIDKYGNFQDKDGVKSIIQRFEDICLNKLNAQEDECRVCKKKIESDNIRKSLLSEMLCRECLKGFLKDVKKSLNY